MDEIYSHSNNEMTGPSEWSTHPEASGHHTTNILRDHEMFDASPQGFVNPADLQAPVAGYHYTFSLVKPERKGKERKDKGSGSSGAKRDEWMAEVKPYDGDPPKARNDLPLRLGSPLSGDKYDKEYPGSSTGFQELLKEIRDNKGRNDARPTTIDIKNAEEKGFEMVGPLKNETPGREDKKNKNYNSRNRSDQDIYGNLKKMINVLGEFGINEENIHISKYKNYKRFFQRLRELNPNIDKNAVMAAAGISISRKRKGKEITSSSTTRADADNPRMGYDDMQRLSQAGYGAPQQPARPEEAPPGMRFYEGYGLQPDNVGYMEPSSYPRPEDPQ